MQFLFKNHCGKEDADEAGVLPLPRRLTMQAPMYHCLPLTQALWSIPSTAPFCRFCSEMLPELINTAGARALTVATLNEKLDDIVRANSNTSKKEVLRYLMHM
jgi:hypothetical protein